MKAVPQCLPLMPTHPLATLVHAGILERAPSRAGSRLRVTPRFLAHAEDAAGRLALHGYAAAPSLALERAISTWDAAPHDAVREAAFLREFLGDRGQFGALQPVFPAIESYARASATA